MPAPGTIVDISEFIRAYDERNVSYWINGPVLILEANEYDVTLLVDDLVLYTSSNSHVFDQLEV